MILPILISLSLAPGSYFFCAEAVVALMTAAANAASTNRLVIRAGIVLSRLATYFDQVSQVRRTHASIGLSACDGQGVAPFMRWGPWGVRRLRSFFPRRHRAHRPSPGHTPAPRHDPSREHWTTG